MAGKTSSSATPLPGRGRAAGAGRWGLRGPLTSTFSGRAYGLAVGDVNGDGFPDVAVSLTGPTSTIEVSLGNGDGTLRTAVPVTTQTTLALGLGDFDGDRRADLVAADDLKLRFWHSNGDGSFSTPSTDMPLSYQSFGASGRMWLADFDGDSALDILAINGATSAFRCCLARAMAPSASRRDRSIAVRPTWPASATATEMACWTS